MTVEELANVAIDVDGFTTRQFALDLEVVAIPTAAEPRPVEAPARPVVLAPNYPNPFRTETTMAFEVPETQHVRLGVFDLLGREVAVLSEGTVPAGRHEVTFNGRSLPAGVYLYRIQTEHRTLSRRMVFIP